ncbi:hypothetical protein Bpfe_004659 [Biomphalaria pfeifferi]|uniref:Uncharacterized protein n=1 Tax=Biomphalaria pfeifferi TaxID=112525 RepID=A0AAD8C3L1_BIOPF|nr:hypothetical protein Bpfe_004659 [Biomphalaria pfeifferi]
MLEVPHRNPLLEVPARSPLLEVPARNPLLEVPARNPLLGALEIRCFKSLAILWQDIWQSTMFCKNKAGNDNLLHKMMWKEK